MWKQFWGFWKCKICHFNTFRGSELWFWWFFALFERSNFPNEQYSKPLNMLQWQIMQFENPQNWFHVKSEWYKYHGISTLRFISWVFPNLTVLQQVFLLKNCFLRNIKLTFHSVAISWFMISLRFYVKSILGILEVQNQPF